MRRRKRNDNPFTLFAFQDIITSVTGILILITLILALSIVTRPMNDAIESRENMQELRSQMASLESDVLALEEQTSADSKMVELMAQFDAGSIEKLDQELRSSISITRRILNEGSIKNVDAERKVNDVQLKIDQQNSTLEQLAGQIQKQKELLEKVVDSNRVVYQFPDAGGEQPWLIDVGGDRWLAAPANMKQKPTVFADNNLQQRLRQLEKWHESNVDDRKYLVLLVRPDGVDSYQRIRDSASLYTAEFGVDLIASDITVIDSETGAVIQ